MSPDLSQRLERAEEAAKLAAQDVAEALCDLWPDLAHGDHRAALDQMREPLTDYRTAREEWRAATDAFLHEAVTTLGGAR